jgi:hypothetical protein
MKDYQILEARNIVELTKLVNTYLSQGYSLAGGVCTEIYPTMPPLYYQAVYKV